MLFIGINGKFIEVHLYQRMEEINTGISVHSTPNIYESS